MKSIAMFLVWTLIAIIAATLLLLIASCIINIAAS